MKDIKKDNYWGTSVKKYITDGENNYNEEGFIYLNLRDCKDIGKILDTIDHELEHLIGPESRNRIIIDLKREFLEEVK